MNSSELKIHLIKNMNDDQLAKTINSVRNGLFKLMSKKDIHLVIQECINRHDTKNIDLINFQDYYLKRAEKVLAH
jgi:hypothetical protein